VWFDEFLDQDFADARRFTPGHEHDYLASDRSDVTSHEHDKELAGKTRFANRGVSQ